MWNPKLPTLHIYEKQLKDVEFPLSFKFCIKQKNNSAKYQRYGYVNYYSFFSGESMHNTSINGNGAIVGWAGHKEDGSTCGSVKSIFY